ncbi:CHAD domain containing protein [Crinalium epipsammum PCC 9333]|uniref:CHAD domain containing protein n=2 Tax=Crinalium TaxID=241421 RepID=K9W008_9CYAN|nr:CHAD domain containing protein [Crinalium epipsammum PCC 9333]
MIAKTNTLGDWGYIAIEQHLHKILKHEEDVLNDRDPEALHQMRVGMRRLRSAVTGFQVVLDLPKAAAEKKIGKIARILGELRDLDVLKETLLNEYEPELPKSEQKYLKQVLNYLGKQRKQALTKVQSALESKSYQHLKKALKKWLDEPQYLGVAQLPIYEVLPDLLLPSVSEFLLHPGWLVGVQVAEGKIGVSKAMPQSEVEQLLIDQGKLLHSLRKETKRSRYQMELFTEFYGSKYLAHLEDLKEIQKILGEIQDSVVLSEFITAALDSDSKKQLPTLVKQLLQNSYKSWQHWQFLQNKYLNAETRTSFRLELLNPIEQPSDLTK